MQTEKEFYAGNNFLPLLGEYLAHLISISSYIERERKFGSKVENDDSDPVPVLDQTHLEDAISHYASIARVCFTLAFDFYIPIDLEGGGKHMMSSVLVSAFVKFNGLRNIVGAINHVGLYLGALMIGSVLKLKPIPNSKEYPRRWSFHDSSGGQMYPIRDARDLEPLNDIVCDRLMSLNDEELKSEDNDTLSTLLWNSAQLGTVFFPHINFLKKHVTFLRKCLNSAVLEKRLFAIKYLCRYCMIELYAESEGYSPGIEIRGEELVKCVKDEHILTLIFGESMHTEILKKSNDLVQYLAFHDGIRPSDLKMMWCAIDGKRDDEIALMYRLLAISLRLPMSEESTFSFPLLSYLVQNLIMRGDPSRLIKSSFLKFIDHLRNLIIHTKDVSNSSQGKQCRSLFLNLVWYFLEQNDARLNEVFDETMVQLINSGFTDRGNLYQHMKRTLNALQEETIAPNSGMKILEALLTEGSYALCSSDNPSKVEVRAASSEIIRNMDTEMGLFKIIFNGIKKAVSRAKYAREEARAFLHGIHTFLSHSDFTLSRHDLRDMWAYLSTKDLDCLMKYFQAYVVRKELYLERPVNETAAYVFDTLVSRLPSRNFTCRAFITFQYCFFVRNEAFIEVEHDGKSGNWASVKFISNISQVVGIEKFGKSTYWQLIVISLRKQNHS